MITKSQLRRRLGLPPNYFIKGKVWRRYLRRRYPPLPAVDPDLTAISCQYSGPVSPFVAAQLDFIRPKLAMLYEREDTYFRYIFGGTARLTAEEREALMPENRAPSSITGK